MDQVIVHVGCMSVKDSQDLVSPVYFCDRLFGGLNLLLIHEESAFRHGFILNLFDFNLTTPSLFYF